MKFRITLLLATIVADATASAVAVAPIDSNDAQPLARAADPGAIASQDLWKRRGGGGSGGRGSGGSGGTGTGKPSGGSGSGSGTGSGRGSSSANTGGSTTTGSGPRPAYGGGSYYGGGARSPYASGGLSPLGVAPFLLVGSALLFWPGIWLHGAYLYHYPSQHSYYNASNNKNETKPVICACDSTVECGCDDSNNSTQYWSDLLGNGSYNGLNKSLVTVADVNGSSTILINGTLPNGTTSSGGTDSPDAGAGTRALLEAVGWWPALVTVLAITLFA